MKPIIEVIEVEGRKTFCSFDDDENVWTLSLLEHGGPIVCDKDFETALKDFKEALGVCLAIDVMWMHARMSKEGASDEEIKEAWKKKRKL